MRPYYDPQSLWLLTGLAIRSGQRAGIHREAALQEHSLFEAEIRRRIWWQVAILDNHSARLSGTASILTLPCDTRRPLNVNDSDLHPNMKDIPVEHTGPTEMLFCSIRYEIGMLIQKAEQAQDDRINGKVNAGSSRSAALQAVDELERICEQKYLRHCDSSISFHLQSTYLVRSAICNLRLRAYHPRQPRDSDQDFLLKDKDTLLSLSLEMMEYDNLAHSTPSLRGYLWHTNVFFPYEAFIYILNELSTGRVEGALCQKTWHQVNQVYENHPEMVHDNKNALHVAIGNLAVRAWEKCMANGNTPEAYGGLPLERISALRAQRTKNRSTSVTSGWSRTTPSKGGEASIARSQVMDDVSHTDLAEGFAQTDLSGVTETDMEFMDWDYWQNLIQGRDLNMYDIGGHL